MVNWDLELLVLVQPLVLDIVIILNTGFQQSMQAQVLDTQMVLLKRE